MVSQESTKKYGFSTPGYDWERYARVRPKYRDAVWNLILQYHRSKGGQFSVAHDIGSGYGVVAKDFLYKHFEHTYVSDPVQLEAAEYFLKDLIEAGKIEPRQAGAEDRWLPDGSVDMVTAFECLHWTDPIKSIPAIAAQLKPGGTFVALYYPPRPFIRHNQRADAAWKKVYDICARDWTKEGTISSRFLPQAYDGLNGHVPLSEDLFEPGAKRIRINAELMSLSPLWSPEEAFRVGSAHTAKDVISCVGPRDACVDVVDEANWGEDVDYQWLEDVLLSFSSSFPLDEAEQEMKELRAALEEEGGTTKILWMVDIVLATKKKA